MVEGTVKYINLEMGFWAIVEDNGGKWMIIDMPEQIKYEGKRVRVKLEPIDAMTTGMWGTPARLIRFQTLEP
jgi:hypothetical protein